MKVGASIHAIRLVLLHYASNKGRGQHHCDKTAAYVPKRADVLYDLRVGK